MKKMVKWLAPVAILALALACGSSDSSSSGSTVLTRANVDSSVAIADIENVQLFKITDGDAAAAATYTTTNVSAVTNADHLVIFSNIEQEASYLLKVVSDNGAELFQAVIEVTADNEVQALGAAKEAPSFFQVNALTTYIVSIAGNTLDSAALEDAIEEVLGAGADAETLNSLYLDGETILEDDGDTFDVDSDKMAAINYVSILVVAAAALPEGDDAISDVASLITNVAAAESFAELETALSENLTSIFSAVEDDSFASTIVDIAPVFAESLGIDEDTSLDDLGEALEADAAELETAADASTNDSATVSNFVLADTSFGTSQANIFNITTLAPVFKVTFERAVNSSRVTAAIESLVITEEGGASKTLSADDEDIIFDFTSTTEMYIAIDASGTKSLSPGVMYSYEINAEPQITLGSGNAWEYGTITTSYVTVTASSVPMAFDGSETFMGLESSSDLSFSVDVAEDKYIIAEGASSNLYGLLTTNAVTIGTDSESVEFQSDFLSIDSIEVDGTVVTSASSGDNLTGGTVSLDDRLNLTSGNYSVTYDGIFNVTDDEQMEMEVSINELFMTVQ